MMSVLLVFLLFAVLQVAAVFYVRSIVSSAAADGARYGANAGVDPADGGPRASTLIERAMSAGMARQIPCVGAQTVDVASGLLTSAVACRGKIKSIFFPIGAFVTIDATGQSLKEQP